jgi:hypothetical protein
MVAFAGFTDFLTSGQGADVVEVSSTELVLCSAQVCNTYKVVSVTQSPHTTDVMCACAL